MKTFQPHLQAFRDGGELYRLFEHIPDVLFFAKDGEGRLIMGNQRFVEHCGLSLIDELAGKSDYDIFPNYMADKFATDDRCARLREAIATSGGTLSLPGSPPRMVHNEQVPDFRRQRESGSGLRNCAELRAVILRLERRGLKSCQTDQNKFDQTLSIPELSKKAGLSQRQLERLFKKRFSITPREYIIRLRVLIAADQPRFTSKRDHRDRSRLRVLRPQFIHPAVQAP